MSSSVRTALHSVLSSPLTYLFWDYLVGGPASRRKVLNKYVRAKAGDHILDIGCGPGNMVPYFANAQYSGFDRNPEYIAAARAKFGEGASFDCARVATYNLPVAQGSSYDLTIAFGVLHHVDDEEALQLFRLAHAALKPGGRLITYDGCYVPAQHSMARRLLSWDRGLFVRTEREYLRLASSVFSSISSNIHHELLRIPYTMIVLECVR